MRLMVFVPIDRSEVFALRAQLESGLVMRVGHAATASLMRSLGYDDTMLEDAEFAALTHAGVRSVIIGHDELRLVVAAEIDRTDLDDTGDAYGTVTVKRLGWADVHALFVDEDAARSRVAEARAAVQGHDLTFAVQQPTMAALTDEHDLLWYAPEEVDDLQHRRDGADR